MRDQSPSIINFVEDQFPDFYHTDGQKFIQFVKAYYEWLAEENNIGDLTSKFYNLRDIDLTIDEFVLYFKQKYLINFNPSAGIDTRKLVKHAVELFGTKGTEQSIKLLFQLLYNQEITVYYPGDDVIKASDGKWYQPMYLEVSTTDKTKTFIYREIEGSASGAKAFVESIVRKNINSHIFDVIFLSNVRGTFQAGERLTTDGVIEGAPIVLGSLIDINITDGGANNAIGDILNVIDGSGRGAKVRVSGVETQTGRVSFIINYGGTGYRLTSNVHVAEQTMSVSDLSDTIFETLETVQQENQSIGFVSGSGNTSALVTIGGYAANGTQVANGTLLNSNSTVVIVNIESGDFVSASTIRSTANVFTAVTANVANVYATGMFVGYNPDRNQVGLDSVDGTFYEDVPVVWVTSGISATVNTLYTGIGAGFSIGSIIDEQISLVYSDLLAANNSANVGFTTIYLSGNNSGLANGAYGFPKSNTANLTSLLSVALSSNLVSFGTIGSLTSISPGENYNSDVIVSVVEPLVAGFNVRNVITELSDSSGTLMVGEEVSQTIPVTGQTITINYSSGTFSNTEGVNQAVSLAAGQIRGVNATHIIVTSINEVPFVVGQNITGVSSGAIANATALAFANTTRSAVGIVVTANTIEATISPTAFNTEFRVGVVIIGTGSGASGNVFHIYEDTSSEGAGKNADIEGLVVTANGIISQVAVVDSGYGFINNETLTLEHEGNPVVSTGNANVNASGIGRGFWKNTDGMLNSDKYIHDNDYYQAFSYEIQSGISLERYSELLKTSFHQAGTKLFGKVVKVSIMNKPLTTTESDIEVV